MSLTPINKDAIDRLIAVEKKMADILSGRAGLRPDPRFMNDCSGGAGFYYARLTDLPDFMGGTSLDFLFVGTALYVWPAEGDLTPSGAAPMTHGWGLQGTWDIAAFDTGGGDAGFRQSTLYLPEEISSRLGALSPLDDPDFETIDGWPIAHGHDDVTDTEVTLRIAKLPETHTFALLTRAVTSETDFIATMPALVFERTDPILVTLGMLTEAPAAGTTPEPVEVVGTRFVQVVEEEAVDVSPLYIPASVTGDEVARRQIIYRRYGPRAEGTGLWYYEAVPSADAGTPVPIEDATIDTAETIDEFGVAPYPSGWFPPWDGVTLDGDTPVYGSLPFDRDADNEPWSYEIGVTFGGGVSLDNLAVVYAPNDDGEDISHRDVVLDVDGTLLLGDMTVDFVDPGYTPGSPGFYVFEFGRGGPGDYAGGGSSDLDPEQYPRARWFGTAEPL